MTPQPSPTRTSSPDPPSNRSCTSTEPVGHLLFTPHGLTGSQGIAYDYICARTGVFVQASADLLIARFQIARVRFSGLSSVDSTLRLPRGPLPFQLLEEFLAQAHKAYPNEAFSAVIHRPSGYQLATPAQTASASHVSYEPVPGSLLELHTHPHAAATFSPADDNDDSGFRLYGVLGPLGPRATPTLALRVGIYGHHSPASASQIFTGTPPTHIRFDNAEAL